VAEQIHNIDLLNIIGDTPPTKPNHHANQN